MANSETRYNKLEKIALALRMETKQLWTYFQDHVINILTIQPLRLVLHKLDILGCFVKWVFVDFIIELQNNFKREESNKNFGNYM